MRVLVLFALVSASTCASVPNAPSRDDVSRGVAARADAFAPASQREFTAPPGVVLADGVAIDEAVATALWNNQDFQAALSGLGIVRADLTTAGMLRNPILSMLFPWGPKQFEATVNVPLEMIWQRPKRIAEANLNARAAADRLIASGVQLTGDVKLRFVDAISTAEVAALAVKQAEIARQLSGLAGGRFRAGDISEFERNLTVTEAARLDDVRAGRIGARDLAMSELRRLMGMPPDAPPMTLTALTPVPSTACAGPVPGLIQTALASRADVRAAEIDVEAAAARAGVEKSKIFTLTAILDMNGSGKEGFEAGPGLAGELPILSRNEGGRARAAAELDQAGRRYLAVRARVAADVDSAFVRLTQAIAVTEIWNGDAATSLAAQRRQAQRLHDAGEISLLDLLELQRRMNDSESLKIESQTMTARELARLEQALGRSCAAR